MDKSTEKMIIHNEITNEDEHYYIEAEFPFDSTRKRMTLLVRYKNQHILMCKGADSIILPRVDFTDDPQSQQFKLRIARELLDFAKEGLRTLVVG